LKVRVRKEWTEHASADGQAVKILLFGHGGKVMHKSAVYSDEALAPAMIRDHYVPIFLIWNSDEFNSYGDGLCCVIDGKKQKLPMALQPVNVPLRVSEDILAGVATMPMTVARQGGRYIEADIQGGNRDYYLNAPGDNVSPAGREDKEACITRKSTCVIFPPFGNQNYDSPPPLSKSLVYISTFPVRTLVVTPLISRTGARAWDNMVRRTRGAFDSTMDECIDRKTGLVAACREGGFKLFFDELEASLRPAYVRQDGGPYDKVAYLCVAQVCDDKTPTDSDDYVPVTLEFYGHSMGAIVANEALARYPDALPWSKIVYMASAASIRDFQHTAAPTLVAKKIPFYDLSLHPLNEAREHNVFGLVPRGSLLEWVDEMYGNPRTLDDRTMGKWKNVEHTIHTWNRDLLPLMTVRVFPLQDRLRADDRGRQDEKAFYEAECGGKPKPGEKDWPACYPLKHGDFTNYSFWWQKFLVGETVEQRPPLLNTSMLEKAPRFADGGDRPVRYTIYVTATQPERFLARSRLVARSGESCQLLQVGDGRRLDVNVTPVPDGKGRITLDVAVEMSFDAQTLSQHLTLEAPPGNDRHFAADLKPVGEDPGLHLDFTVEDDGAAPAI